MGAVSHIRIKAKDEEGRSASKRGHMFEITRLREKYQGTPRQDGNETGEFRGGNPNESMTLGRHVDGLFPGISPVLPLNFKDIEPNKPIDEDEEHPETMPIKEKRKAPKREVEEPAMAVA